MGGSEILKVTNRAYAFSTAALLVCLNAMQLPNLKGYLSRSFGLSDSPGFVVIRNGSSDRMMERLAKFAQSDVNKKPVLSTALSISVADSTGVAFNGIPVLFTAQDFEQPSADLTHFPIPLWLANVMNPTLEQRAKIVSQERISFPSGGTKNLILEDQRVLELLRDPNTTLLDDDSNQFVINRDGSIPPPASPRELRLKSLHNYLEFQPSILGSTLWSGGSDQSRTMFFPEHDPFQSNSWMQAVGRYGLFTIINPTQRMHLRVALTSTILDHGMQDLVPARIDAAVGSHLNFFGRGSGRLISGPIDAASFGSRYLLQIDLGQDGQLHEVGLPGLFGSIRGTVITDSRYLVGYAREISLISDADYKKLQRPRILSRFPTDLYDSGVEYTGIFEDGWLSTDSFVKLAAASYPAERIVIRGRVPLVLGNENERYHLTVAIDGIIQTFDIGVGNFNLNLPTVSDGREVSVRVTFDHGINLPKPDGRLVGAQIFSIGFEDQPDDLEAQSDVAPIGFLMRFGSGWYPLERYEGKTFRWFSNDAVVTIESPRSGRRELVAEIAPGPALSDARNFKVDLQSANGRTLQVANVDQTGRLVFPVFLNAGLNRFRFHVTSSGLPASAQDPRVLSVRAFQVRLR